MIFVPTYLNKADGIFGKDYYELLVGMDMTVFLLLRTVGIHAARISGASRADDHHDAGRIRSLGGQTARACGREIVLRDDYNDQEVEEKIAESLLHSACWTTST